MEVQELFTRNACIDGVLLTGVCVFAGEAGLAVRVNGAGSAHVLVVHGCHAGRHVRHHWPVAVALRPP